MKTKNIKVAYTTRYPQSGFTTVPKIQMEGRWLEELGFSIGSTIVVEYGEGSIRIRPLTEEEAAIRKQQELQAELGRKAAELRAMEKSLQSAYEEFSKVAEPAMTYSSSSKASAEKK